MLKLKCDFDTLIIFSEQFRRYHWNRRARKYMYTNFWNLGPGSKKVMSKKDVKIHEKIRTCCMVCMRHALYYSHAGRFFHVFSSSFFQITFLLPGPKFQKFVYIYFRARWFQWYLRNCSEKIISVSKSHFNFNTYGISRPNMADIVSKVGMTDLDVCMTKNIFSFEISVSYRP